MSQSSSVPASIPAGDAAPLYEAQGLARSYENGAIQALRSADIKIMPGEFVAILGPSGCGKSTLLGLLGMLDDPDAGSLRYRGESTTGGFDRIRYRSRDVGFVFQTFHLLPTFNALENVEMPMLEMPWSSKERVDRATTLIKDLGLGERMNQLPSKLSGGERQRLAIARALGNKPSILLADEPTGNLDSKNVGLIMELLKDLHQRHQLTIIMVTHDAHVAAYASRQIHMLDGAIVSDKTHGSA